LTGKTDAMGEGVDQAARLESLPTLNARCSTNEQDLAAQQQRLAELGVSPERIYLDRGLTGISHARPGLDQALAAVREGDTLVVPKLEVDLLRMRTREGMAVARARGKLRGKQPKLSPKQQRELVRMARHRRVHYRRPRGTVHRVPHDGLPNAPTARQLTALRGLGSRCPLVCTW
jgi:Resolvase, N terminal domain